MSRSATQNHGQLNTVGNTLRTASSPFPEARNVSLMKRYRARNTPIIFSAQALASLAALTCQAPSLLARLPHQIISTEINTGASTGPHQGSGSKKRMSQSRSECGQPHRALRKR